MYVLRLKGRSTQAAAADLDAILRSHLLFEILLRFSFNLSGLNWAEIQNVVCCSKMCLLCAVRVWLTTYMLLSDSPYVNNDCLM